ncbi:ABC transporter substrate-binding protein [Pseudonocardia acidicola]|uniref:ABC transporter substrate-binding protein n=1 Tax=Pseudonocardia acidicola TaxID=2724939 RepID=A0ABX1S7L2_9PSEU|nr:ABC transporter substrate-binding protein [Pseudonocardia acidicola]NMH96899.1 ABC transporter substrate-binding protein [Pseudonocardia acidicola]
MSTVPVTLACWDYDRTRALADGTVRPAGVALTYLNLPVEETFFRMLRHREFEAAEMSLSSYVTHVGCTAEPDLVAIPVFPSRAFRHHGIYVRGDSDLVKPADLLGGVVGVPEYQLTANVWIRGILADRHDLPVDAVRYRTGGMHEPGRVEKQELDLPPRIEVEPIPPDRTLLDMLLAGEIDALYAPRTPRPMLAGDTSVRRLFRDPRVEEERYAAETGIFPIMHTVVLRRDVYAARPWLARSLYSAFEQAKALTEARMGEVAANPYMVPWLTDELERTRALLGPDFWPYGLDANRTTLAVFLRYAHEQGLTPRRLAPEELFVPETHESYVI